MGLAQNSFNVVVLTVSFFSLFAAYNTLQGYVSTTLPGNLGFQALVTLYVACVSCCRCCSVCRKPLLELLEMLLLLLLVPLPPVLTPAVCSYLLSLPFAPVICNRLGDVNAMILGGACYVVFIASLLLSR